MPIVNFEVVQPPTGGEVVDRALVALGESGILSMVVKASEQQVPPPEEKLVSVQIRQTTHPRQGGMIITGYIEEPRQLVKLRIANNEEPATGSFISA
jgi:hypothetical protein